MSKNVLLVEIGKKNYVLKIDKWNHEIDVDEVLKIDYHNIIGELLTFPVIFNRIANLKAEIDNAYEVKKFSIDVLKAQLEEKYRSSLVEEVTDIKGNKKISKPTVSEIDNAIKRDDDYIKEYVELLETQKQQGYLNSLYWSAQSKDSKLTRISEKIKPEDFEDEIIEKSVNGIMIKQSEKLIK